jgi:Glycosyl hydrolase family 79, N-terminal domain
MYSLACSGTGGNTSESATLTVNPHVLANASTIGATILNDQFGANMCVGFDITNPPSQAATLKTVGIDLVRWPCGSPSDDYHWQTNTYSASPCPYGSPNANSTFDNFEHTIVAAGKFDVAITLNYGSNPACNGPADPNEAAQWVAYAKQQGYSVKYWTVGNEVYSSSETDLHSPGAHDPLTYANNVATQFYPLIKAQDSTAQVGVVVDGGNYTSNNWDSTVLANAMYDFVEIHYYPENPGSESDSFLLTQAPGNFATTFAKVQQELAAAGHPNLPILLGEYNSPNYNPGKQTMSIVNALFIGMVQGEILKAGISSAVIEDASFNTQCNTTGNNSSSLYGWQNFGSYELFAGNSFTCPNTGTIPVNTPLPIAEAFGLSSQFGIAGNSVIGVNVSSALTNVRAYAAQQGNGYSLLLFNLDESNAVTLTVGVANATKASYSANMTTYDKALYDQSQSNVWAAPTTTQLGTVTLPLTVTLQPWSMNVIVLQ